MPINLKRIAVVVVFLTICGASALRAMGQQTSAPRTSLRPSSSLMGIWHSFWSI